MGSSVTKKRLLLVAVTAFLLFSGVVLAFAFSTWSEVNRVTIDRATPGVGAQGSDDSEEGVEGEEKEPAPGSTEGVGIVLLGGLDSRDQLDDLTGFGDFPGERADVIMVLIRTRSATAVMSLPRDLLAEDPCTGRQQRINTLIADCGAVLNGPSRLLQAVERLIGERVDHYAMVDLAGFQQVVEVIGGYEICLDLPVRDQRAHLELPAGCSLAGGEETLAWLRSRHTQELTASGWRTMPGMNDLTRNQRQRRFVIDVLARLSYVSSPQALSRTARAIAPHVTVDDQLTITEAVNLVWALRGLDRGAFTELEVPVTDHVTEEGAAVLVATTPIDGIVAGFLETHATADVSDPRAG